MDGKRLKFVAAQDGTDFDLPKFQDLREIEFLKNTKRKLTLMNMQKKIDVFSDFQKKIKK